jgi:hypothetical protein
MSTHVSVIPFQYFFEVTWMNAVASGLLLKKAEKVIAH